MRNIFRPWSHPFHNGGRFWVGTLIFLFILLTLITSINAYDVIGGWLYNPMGDYGLQTVDNPRGDDGIPVVHIGERLLVTATKCLNQDALVRTQYDYHSVDGALTVVYGNSSVGEKKAGCSTDHYANILPADLTPGLWQIVGTASASQGGWQDVTAFESEPFRLEP